MCFDLTSEENECRFRQTETNKKVLKSSRNVVDAIIVKFVFSAVLSEIEAKRDMMTYMEERLDDCGTRFGGRALRRPLSFNLLTTSRKQRQNIAQTKTATAPSCQKPQLESLQCRCYRDF